MSVSEFKVPELGENVVGGDVMRVLVNVGDTIARDQPVLELETDKATIEVPSSVAGVVKEVRVKSGDKVKVGAVVLTVDDASSASAATGNGGGAAAENAPPKAEAKQAEAKQAEAKQQDQPAPATQPAPAAEPAPAPAPAPAEHKILPMPTRAASLDPARDASSESRKP